MAFDVLCLASSRIPFWQPGAGMLDMTMWASQRPYRWTNPRDR
jgi:hypothetical protein